GTEPSPVLFSTTPPPRRLASHSTTIPECVPTAATLGQPSSPSTLWTILGAFLYGVRPRSSGCRQVANVGRDCWIPDYPRGSHAALSSRRGADLWWGRGQSRCSGSCSPCWGKSCVSTTQLRISGPFFIHRMRHRRGPICLQ